MKAFIFNFDLHHKMGLIQKYKKVTVLTTLGKAEFICVISPFFEVFGTVTHAHHPLAPLRISNPVMSYKRAVAIL